jgi:hypothetical protein
VGLEQVVEAASHPMAFQDFRLGLHRGAEGVHHVDHRAVEHDLDEHHQCGTQLGRIEPRLVAEDEALAGESLDAFEHCCGRQVHRLGRLEVGDASALSQHAQVLQVQAVDVACNRAGTGRCWRSWAGAFRGRQGARCAHATSQRAAAAAARRPAGPAGTDRETIRASPKSDAQP